MSKKAMRALVVALRQQARNDSSPFDTRESNIEALVFDRESFVVHSQAVEHTRIEIVDMHGIFHDVVAVVVGAAVIDSRAESATGDPGGKAAASSVA